MVEEASRNKCRETNSDENTKRRFLEVFPRRIYVDLRSLQRTSTRHITYWNKRKDKGGIYLEKPQRIRAKEKLGNGGACLSFLLVGEGEVGRFL